MPSFILDRAAVSLLSLALVRLSVVKGGAFLIMLLFNSSERIFDGIFIKSCSQPNAVLARACHRPLSIFAVLLAVTSLGGLSPVAANIPAAETVPGTASKFMVKN